MINESRPTLGQMGLSKKDMEMAGEPSAENSESITHATEGVLAQLEVEASEGNVPDAAVEKLKKSSWGEKALLATELFCAAGAAYFAYESAGPLHEAFQAGGIQAVKELVLSSAEASRMIFASGLYAGMAGAYGSFRRMFKGDRVRRLKEALNIGGQESADESLAAAS
jgi:hypothetical protein